MPEWRLQSYVKTPAVENVRLTVAFDVLAMLAGAPLPEKFTLCTTDPKTNETAVPTDTWMEFGEKVFSAVALTVLVATGAVVPPVFPVLPVLPVELGAVVPPPPPPHAVRVAASTRNALYASFKETSGGKGQLRHYFTRQLLMPGHPLSVTAVTTSRCAVPAAA
jgi:hypothetical protein